MNMKLNTVREEISFGSNILDVVVPDHLRHKVKTGIKFIDNAMGGEGFTPSMSVFFTGEAGAGKSTMLQILADRLTEMGHLVVYITGEESPYQIKMQAERLQLKHGFAVAQETHLPTLLPQLTALVEKHGNGKTPFVLFDSLQTMDDGKYECGHTNSKTPIRSIQAITDWAKENYGVCITIGQVNKDGIMAGSNVIKHAVDAYIHLAIEKKDKDLEGCRILETYKNRFGGAGDITFLALEREGFREVMTVSARI